MKICYRSSIIILRNYNNKIKKTGDLPTFYVKSRNPVLLLLCWHLFYFQIASDLSLADLSDYIVYIVTQVCNVIKYSALVIIYYVSNL